MILQANPFAVEASGSLFLYDLQVKKHRMNLTVQGQ